jgi:hypothetical protein
MQLVIEFGSEKLTPIVEAILNIIGDVSYTLECRAMQSDTYEPTQDSLQSAVLKLSTGGATSVLVRPRTGPIRYILAFSPSQAERLSLYMGTVDYTGRSYGPIWELLLRTSGLKVVCVGYEEGMELRDTCLTEDTFPWKQWPLVIGALRSNSDSETWIIREGPQIKWFKSPASDR